MIRFYPTQASILFNRLKYVEFEHRNGNGTYRWSSQAEEEDGFSNQSYDNYMDLVNQGYYTVIEDEETQCQHEWINVGFTSLTIICKNCGVNK